MQELIKLIKLKSDTFRRRGRIKNTDSMELINIRSAIDLVVLTEPRVMIKPAVQHNCWY